MDQPKNSDQLFFLPVTLKPETRHNLRKLARFLEQLPDNYEHFDMRQYYTVNGRLQLRVCNVDEAIDKHPCGTTACAIGHAFDAGIEFPHKMQYWMDIADYLTDYQDAIFKWLFHGGWAFTDNTAQGVAKRIHQLLDQGLPKNYSKQCDGIVPLSYLNRENNDDVLQLRD